MAKNKRGSNGLYTLTATVEENGEKKRKYFRGKTLQEAKRKMMEWEAAVAAGRTFKEVAEAWEKDHWKDIKAGTHVSYNPSIKRAIAAFGSTPIKDIEPLDLKRSLDLMGKQGYAHHSVVIYRSVLNQIFDYAVLNQDIQINPILSVKVPKGLSAEKRECPEDNALEIIDNNVDHEFGMFAYMLRYTGLRRGELLALQWSDVDFEQRRISITKSVTYAEGNQPVITTPKTRSSIRKVVMISKLASKLKPLQGKPDEYLFGKAKPLTENVFEARWRKYCLDVGLWSWGEVTRKGKGNKKITVMVRTPNVTPHQLRHAYATMCYDCGVDPKDTQIQMGHSRVEITLDTYTHIKEKRMLQVELKLNQA